MVFVRALNAARMQKTTHLPRLRSSRHSLFAHKARPAIGLFGRLFGVSGPHHIQREAVASASHRPTSLQHDELAKGSWTYKEALERVGGLASFLQLPQRPRTYTQTAPHTPA